MDDNNWTYWEKQYKKIMGNKHAEQYRTNCFWYRPWQDMSATMYQCELAETGTCPCETDCSWFISREEVDQIIYTRLDVSNKMKFE